MSSKLSVCCCYADAAPPQLRSISVEPVAPVAYQVIVVPGIGQFRETEPRRVHTRINSLELFLVHKLTCGTRESVSFFFFFSHTLLSSFWTYRGHRCRPFFPPILAFNFHRA